MSASTRRAYAEHRSAAGLLPLEKTGLVAPCIDISGRRMARTEPPPATLPNDLRMRASELRRMGMKLLAEANELEQAADRID